VSKGRLLGAVGRCRERNWIAGSGMGLLGAEGGHWRRCDVAGAVMAPWRRCDVAGVGDGPLGQKGGRLERWEATGGKRRSPDVVGGNWRRYKVAGGGYGSLEAM
jgi:hypothetical protein